RHPVRDADGPAALSGGDRVGHPGPGALARASTAPSLAAPPAARPGYHLPEMLGERPGEALRHGGGPGRGSRSLLDRRTARGPPNELVGAQHEVGQTSADGRGDDPASAPPRYPGCGRHRLAVV